LANALYLGIDFGTSGCRAIAIDRAGDCLAQAHVSLPEPVRNGEHGLEQDPEIWWQALCQTLRDLACQTDLRRCARLSVDGTSATLLLTDAEGMPLTPAWMYNDARSRKAAQLIAAHSPTAHAAHGPTSSLAKCLTLQQLTPGARHALHQGDWILGRLSNRFDLSDENNALKLGYDPLQRQWPGWLADLGLDSTLLPHVQPAGSEIGLIDPHIASELGLADSIILVSGTTDSTAAVLASGATRYGDAVTSVGSTLVMKILSDRPIFDARHGLYSQRLGSFWLVGGASNSGGCVLLQHFTVQQLSEMTPALQPDHSTGLDYYPLPATGERFPYADPDMQSRITPRPDQDVVFFQALLEGLAAIEAQGYRVMEKAGAPALLRVISIGGGAANEAWCKIRARQLGVPVEPARHMQAAYGAALLAAGQIP